MARLIRLWILTFLFIAPLKLQNLYGQEKKRDKEITKSIKRHGSKFLKSKNINSVSIGIYFDGEVYSEHFGEIEIGKGNTPNDLTLYEIGSISKTITGYLAAKAVLDGKIKLEEDIRIYLEADYPNLILNDSPILVKHLLTHTSGLPMFLPLAMNGLYETLKDDVPDKYLALEKSYDKVKFLEDLKTISLASEPGTQYAYSNAGAELMGHILEKALGKNIENLMKEAFTDKHGIMADAIQPRPSQKLVQGYWLNNKTPAPNQFNSLWSTAGGMKMSMRDMLKYMEIQLNDDDPIISESHKRMFQSGNTSKIAYYWQLQEDKYGRSFNHHGGTSGVQNWLFLFPKYDLAISIITNQSGPKTPTLLGKTAKALLKSIIKN